MCDEDDEEDYKSSLYPLDVAQLERGHTITQEECEKLTGVSASHRNYSLALCKLVGDIHTQRSRHKPPLPPLSLTTRGNAIYINTDAEASEYHTHQAKLAERRIYRNAHFLANAVRPGQLTDNERRSHERRTLLLAQKVMRLKQNTPKIEGPKEATTE